MPPSHHSLIRSLPQLPPIQLQWPLSPILVRPRARPLPIRTILAEPLHHRIPVDVVDHAPNRPRRPQIPVKPAPTLPEPIRHSPVGLLILHPLQEPRRVRLHPPHRLLRHRLLHRKTKRINPRLIRPRKHQQVHMARHEAVRPQINSVLRQCPFNRIHQPPTSPARRQKPLIPKARKVQRPSPPRHLDPPQPLVVPRRHFIHGFSLPAPQSLRGMPRWVACLRLRRHAPSPTNMPMQIHRHAAQFTLRPRSPLAFTRTRLGAPFMQDQWQALLSDSRVPPDSPGPPPARDESRTPSEADYARVISSPPSRRLARKPQAPPLALNDHVRTRLTHSLEVACVGRGLAKRLHKFLHAKNHLPPNRDESDIVWIMMAACAAHDIGNPPFGHAGEY